MSILNNLLYNADTISSLEAAYGLGGSGLPSQARHQAAVNELAKTLTPVNFGPANFLGKTAAFLGASATEIPDLIKTGDFREAARDIKDNFIGAFLTNQNKTPADIFAKVYGMGDTGSPIKTETTGGIRTTQPPSFRSLNDPKVYEGPERESLLSKILELGQGLGGGILDAAKGAGNVLSNLGIVGALRNFDNFKNLSPLDRQFILKQAGGNRPMKDAFGYNIRSARGNYAQLVKDRAKLADFRKSIGKPMRAIDKYYLDKEKERQAALRKQIQESIQRESGADSYTSQAMAHESKVGRDSGERMGRI